MRTLGLLAALLVLALPAWAEPLKGAAEQLVDTLTPMALTAKDQAPVMDGQDQPEDEEQDMSVSFYRAERLTREASARRRSVCSCRLRSCKSYENQIGFCRQDSTTYRLCCGRR